MTKKRNYKDDVFRTLFNNEEKLPELYVSYNGKADYPEEGIIKLSDNFAVKCDTIAIEAVVKVVNVNYKKGARPLKKYRIMNE